MKTLNSIKYHVTITFLMTSLMAISQNREWERVSLYDDANTVFTILQDSEGLIWFGTNQGLYDFDGYHCHPHYHTGARSNSHIYCGVEMDKKFYLGSELGILIYDIKKNDYIPCDNNFPIEVRALSADNGMLWIGTLNGLFRYDPANNVIENFSKEIPHTTVYSLLQVKNGDLYIGTYDGLCRRSHATGKTEEIALPRVAGRRNLFVNSMAADEKNGRIWIGSEGALYKYDLSSNEATEIPALRGNSIKSLALNEEGDVIAGTDNGLFIHNQSGTRHYQHDSRLPKSLSNDVVWSLFVDKDDNIWAGTEYDVSLAVNNQKIEVTSIGHLTGRGDGNRFYTLFRDSRDYLWLGGTNGIIRYKNGHSRWYMMGDEKNPISHNRVRDIFEDANANLWVATDGSINRFDFNKEQFINYSIIDETGTFNSNWSYAILEDNNHNLWVGSYLGGIHMIERDRLIASPGMATATRSYNTNNGLPNNLINRMAIDEKGDKWIILFKDGNLVKIEHETNRVYTYNIGEQLGALPSFLICDSNDRLWCAYQGGIAEIGKNGMVRKKIPLSDRGNETIKDIEIVGEDIWVATSREVWAVKRDDYTLKVLPLPNKNFTAIYYDAKEEKVILGSVDELVHVSPSIAHESQPSRPITITAISLNDEPVTPGISPRYVSELHLSPMQDRIAIQFSDLNYALNNKPRYEYRVVNLHSQWVLLPEALNTITIPNIHPGSYTLQIRPANDADKVFTFRIYKSRPWFNRWWARGLYVIIFVGVIAGIIHYFNERKRLNKERDEKEELLEKARETIQNMARVNEVTASKPLEVQSADERLLSEMATIVATNISNPDLNVTYLAEKTGISSKQVYRKIKQYLGITPVEFIRHIRLKKAAQLLEQKNFSVSEVMYMVGFNSHGYFSKCFSKQFGCSPRTFVERL